MNLISGIWMLDVCNLLKYNGVDIFDSILNVTSGTWWIVWAVMIVICIGIGVLKALTDK